MRDIWLIAICILASALSATAAERGVNLLASPGFEADAGWEAYESGFAIDADVARSGDRSARCASEDADTLLGAVQTITLSPPVRTPIRITGYSRAEGVVVAGDYNIYVDVAYEDGTNLWGQRADFSPGTHDWERAEVVFTPEKPVARLLVHTLFRRSLGTVWFDDLTVELLPMAADVSVAGGAGQAAARAQLSMPATWRASLTQNGLNLPVREGTGADVRASWTGLQPGPATLAIEATDEYLGESITVTQPFTVDEARPAPLLWTAHSLEKIRTDSPVGPDTEVTIAAGRGEVEHAQVIITPKLETSNLRVAATDLTGPDGARIAAENLTVRQVLEYEGEPDVLAPIEPLSITAWTNRPIWLTVRVPLDATPGDYRGAVTVGDASVPVRLTVWQFSLPVRPSIPAVLGIADRTFAKRYGLQEGTPEWEQALDEWYRFLIDYRMSPYFCKFGQRQPNHYSYPAPWPIGDPRTDEYLADERLAVIAVPYPLGGDPERLRESLDHLRAKGWLDRAYVYMWDEPDRTEQYEKIREWAAEVHAIAPEVRVLTSFYCAPKDGPHEGDITALPEILGEATQIYCMSQWATHADEQFRARIQSKMAAGDEWWLYVCLGPGAGHPNLFLSMPGVQPRAVMWRLWKEQAEGFLYWALNSYVPAKSPDEPLAMRGPAGDGALVYPGEVFGYSGPLASARLERWRDGMEDYEYLRAYAERFGRDAALQGLGTVYHGPVSHTNDARQIETWRALMAEALAE